MSYLSRHLSLTKSGYLSKLFSRLTLKTDHVKGINILDDWELIELLDQELTGNHDGEGYSDEEGNVEMWDEDLLSAFLRGSRKMKYRILSKDDVRQCLEEKVRRMCDVLSLSRSEAIILLLHFKWSVHKAQDEWLTCEDKVRKAVGLYTRPIFVNPDPKKMMCWACGENYPKDMMFAVSCGHPLCGSCWTEYTNEAICSGDACLTLRCPVMSCNAAVGLEMIELVSPQEDKKKYDNYLLKSCVAGSRKVRWCPAEGCEYAVFASDSGEDIHESTCRCLKSFCWNCLREAHAPADCSSVGEWLSEIVVQSGNWMLANANPCPKCKRPIEKESCVMYTRCTMCDYVFNGDGRDTSSDEDELEPFRVGHTACDNAYVRAYDNAYVRELARRSLQKYQQYYDGWLINESARANAAGELKLMQENQIEILRGIWDRTPEDMQFLEEAHLQVVECRRILKWTYVYGYFLPDAEQPKKNLFGFLQEQAVNLVNMLERLVDSLQNVLKEEISLMRFTEFRRKLIQLTRVLRNYFERMVEALKSGLPEVCAAPPPTPVKSFGPSQTSFGEQGNCSKAYPSPSQTAFREQGNCSKACPSPSPSLIPRQLLLGEQGKCSKARPSPSQRRESVGQGRYSSPTRTTLSGVCSYGSPSPSPAVTALRSYGSPSPSPARKLMKTEGDEYANSRGSSVVTCKAEPKADPFGRVKVE